MKFIDRYTFNSAKDFIGKGGFSRVYKAYDNVRKRMVALKFYKGVESDKYDIISEINRMDSLVHPNLIRYFDATIIPSVNAIGEKEETQVGIMEYADSGDISIFFKQKRNAATYKSIILGILKGIEYLHTQNIAHRDLKPKNILLSKETGKLVAKIADFGISKEISSRDTNVSSQLLGSVEYMAPEQFAPAVYGLNGKLTTNIDLWALGIILYEIFTQGLPFGSRTKGITYEQILNNILFQDLEINYDLLPAPYDKIVRRCLVKHAGKRAQSATELIDILEGRKTKPTVDKTPTVTDSNGTETSIIKDKPNIEPNTNKPTTDVSKPDPNATEIIKKPPIKDNKEDVFQTSKIDDVPSDRGTPVRGNSKSILHEINVGKNLFKLGNYVESFKILDKYRFNPEFDTEAEFYLGFMYYNGKCGGAHDPVKGKRMMNKAKAENHPLVLELMLKYVLN